ncbi:MAG TPA: polysaccharide biosynthesis tyrosine autokinase [Gemmatimonadales bacterium]
MTQSHIDLTSRLAEPRFSANGATSRQGDEMGPPATTTNVRAFLAMLRRHLWIALVVAVATTALFGYMLYSAPPEYRAKAVIRLNDSRQALTGGIVGPQADLSGAELKTDIVLSQVQVLLSRAVVSQVVDEGHAAGLRVRPVDFPQEALGRVVLDRRAETDTIRLLFGQSGVTVTHRDEQRQVPYGAPIELPGIRFSIPARPEAEQGMLVILSRDHAIEALLGGLRANPREHTDVIDVTFTAPDPTVAQQVVNGVVRVFVSLNARQSQDQSRRRQEFIEGQIQQTDSLLLETQRALGPYLSQQQTSEEEESAAAVRARMADLMTRREELDADRRVYGDLLTSLERQRQSHGRNGEAGRLPTIVYPPGSQANPIIAQLYTELLRYQTTRDSLTTGAWASATTHPDVQRLDALIVSTEDKLMEAARSHLASLDTRIRALDAIRQSNMVTSRRPTAMAAEASRLNEQLGTLQRMADQLREEYQKARIAASVEGGRVEIVDLAPVPSSPTGVGLSRKLAFALIVGLLAGTGCAAALDGLQRLSTAIRRRDELETALQLPVLSVVPPHNEQPAVQRRLAWLKHVPRFRRGGKQVGRRVSPLANPTSAGAESYRTLRTNLLFSRAVRTIQTLMVTSAAPSEGKSTTAANLAVVFADQGIRVLLIDCDLRRARIHGIFGMSKEPGLTQLIMGTATLESTIRSTRHERLFVLSAGALPPNPSELLGSSALQSLVGQLTREFGMVIIDSPPVLVATDAPILGRMADGVLLVVRAGQTDRGEAAEALRQLTIVGAHVVGAVLNDPDGKVRSGEGGYYAYEYYGAHA